MKLRTIALAALLALPLSAQTVESVAERFVIPSKVLGEERVVWVRTPPGYAAGNLRYPLLILTDGDAQMLHTVTTAAFLAREGRIPQLVIVGISNTDRTRDLTPTRAGMTNPAGGEFAFPTSGGADRFLSFIETELIPWIDGKYRTESLRLFAGHSFGGLFGIHAFTSRPDLFRGIIAAAPALQWDEDLAIRRSAKLMADRKELPVTLYVTAGREAAQLVDSVRRMQTLTTKARPAGFEASYHYFDDEDHGSLVLLTNYHGLRAIFEGWTIPRNESGAITLSWQQIEAHYATQSKKFGLALKVPEVLANQYGYQLLGAGRGDEAIAVFRANAASYPSSPNVYDSLGEAYETTGRPDLAYPQYQKAAEEGEKVNDPNLAIFRTNRDRVAPK